MPVSVYGAARARRARHGGHGARHCTATVWSVRVCVVRQSHGVTVALAAAAAAAARYGHVYNGRPRARPGGVKVGPGSVRVRRARGRLSEPPPGRPGRRAHGDSESAAWTVRRSWPPHGDSRAAGRLGRDRDGTWPASASNFRAARDDCSGCFHPAELAMKITGRLPVPVSRVSHRPAGAAAAPAGANSATAPAGGSPTVIGRSGRWTATDWARGPRARARTSRGQVAR